MQSDFATDKLPLYSRNTLGISKVHRYKNSLIKIHPIIYNNK